MSLNGKELLSSAASLKLEKEYVLWKRALRRHGDVQMAVFENLLLLTRIPVLIGVMPSLLRPTKGLEEETLGTFLLLFLDGLSFVATDDDARGRLILFSRSFVSLHLPIASVSKDTFLTFGKQ